MDKLIRFDRQIGGTDPVDPVAGYREYGSAGFGQG